MRQSWAKDEPFSDINSFNILSHKSESSSWSYNFSRMRGSLPSFIPLENMYFVQMCIKMHLVHRLLTPSVWTQQMKWPSWILQGSSCFTFLHDVLYPLGKKKSFCQTGGWENKCWLKIRRRRGRKKKKTMVTISFCLYIRAMDCFHSKLLKSIFSCDGV